MTIDSNPSSFDIVTRGGSQGAADEVPPASFTHEGVRYDLVMDGEGWMLHEAGQPLGRLERDHPTAANTPLHWRIRDPHNDSFGIGASWGDWQDALVALIDYRAQQQTRTAD